MDSEVIWAQSVLAKLYLWVDLRGFRNENGTTGLAPLGHMQMKIPRIDMELGELREWLLNIIC